MLRKISSIGLSITTAAWLLAGVMPAGAATVEELQAQIAQLLAQITALQSQLGSTQSASTGASMTFSRDLTVGSKGDDVTGLQSFLAGQAGAKWPAGQAATGYFGNVTKTALANYQGSVNISPAAGYFGPKTRAYVNSLAVSGGTTTGGTTTGGTTTGGIVVAPAGGIAVSLASSNPVAGSLISSALTAAARVSVLAVNLTAGNASGVTVSELKFTKTGVMSDTSISSAYLMESGRVVAQYSSLSSGVITFSGMALSIAAGQTRTFVLGIDPATGLSAGNTIGFSVKAAADVKAVDAANAAVTAAGSFPVQGNTFTVTTVSNPAIATAVFASSSVGTSVYAGTTNVLVSQWSVTVSNSPVNLTSINFKVIGSANKSDLKNVKMMVNGIQVGSTLASVSADGLAYFDLTSAPARLQSGSSNVQVYADIMGSPNYNFQFELLNSYDIYAVDTQYNVPVAVTITGGTGVQVSINPGSITVTTATDSPTGNLARGGSGLTVAKFNIYAAGEPLKVKFLDVSFVTGAAGNATSTLQSIYLVDDQGIQLGTTISNIVDGTSSGQCSSGQTSGALDATGTFYCHFGTTSSNINYIIPANVSRVISVRVNVISTASFTSLTASLPGNTSNLQGQTSSQTANSGAATGGALTISTTPVTVAKNGAVGTQTFAKGSQNIKIGSYVFTAAAAEGVNVTNLTVTMATSSVDLQNLKVMVGGAQFGTTKSNLSGSDVVSFSGSSPIVVPSGSSKVVDIYADILSSAGNGLRTTVTTMTSCTGTGVSSYSSVSCPAAIAGQSLTVSSGATLTITASSASAPQKQVVMGSTNNSLATFRMTDTANVEATRLQTLVVFASTTDNSAANPSFTNIYLYKGTDIVGGPINASSSGDTKSATYTFNFATQPVIPQNGSLELEVKGDVASYSSGGASSNKAYVFKIASSTDITAYGQSSNTVLTVANKTISSANGNALTVLRTKLTLSASVLGTTSGRTRTAVDDVSNIVFAADSGYDVTVNTVSLKFQGMAVSTGTSVTANLIDPSTGSAWSSVSAATCTSAGNSCVASFTFSSVPTVSAGTSKTIKLRIDSSLFYNASQTSDSLSILANSADAVYWGDGVSTGLNLESTVVPIVVGSISYE